MSKHIISNYEGNKQFQLQKIMKEEGFFFCFFFKEVFSKMVSKGPPEEMALKLILGCCASLVGLSTIISCEESLCCLVLIFLVPHKAIHSPKLPLTSSALSHGQGISQAQFFKAGLCPCSFLCPFLASTSNQK